MTEGMIGSSVNRVVVGLGATGLSCARHFYARGLPFSIVDTRRQPPALAEVQRAMPQVPLYLGDIPEFVLETADELVVSPGVSLQEPLVKHATACGATVLGDIDLFVREARAPVLGITGSNAKSTVTEMLGEMALAQGLNVGVGGNLGTPALDLLDDKRDLYVLELSSFQLERCGPLDLAVATVLNISADHLDRHGDMARYHRAKHRIFQGCGKAVVNRNDPLTVPLVPPAVEVINWSMAEPDLTGYGLRSEDGRDYLCHGFERLLPVAELGLAGRHNVANALAALAVGTAAGFSEAVMIEILRNFSGLPHRCQPVGEIAGVRFIDDSKGTNVGATEAALRGLGGDRNIVLIAGGQGKGADFSQLRAAVSQHCKSLVLIGQDAPALSAALCSSAPVMTANTMDEAVAVAAAAAVAGDIVLLSPACASFDMFENYGQRGTAFVRAVAHLPRVTS